MIRVKTPYTLIMSLAFFMMPQVFQASPQAPAANETAVAPKKAGVKRIGVVTGGSQGDAIRPELISLLQGDGTIVDVVPLTSRIEAYRAAEAQRKECDFILEANFEMKAKKEGGGFLDRAKSAAKQINNETGTFSNSQTRINETNRKTDSAANIGAILTPDSKDKVRIGYKLFPAASKQALLTNDKEVAASEVPSFLEKFINDVVTQAIK